jgi:hypothetical protein
VCVSRWVARPVSDCNLTASLSIVTKTFSLEWFLFDASREEGAWHPWNQVTPVLRWVLFGGSSRLLAGSAPRVTACATQGLLLRL